MFKTVVPTERKKGTVLASKNLHLVGAEWGGKKTENIKAYQTTKYQSLFTPTHCLDGILFALGLCST